MRINYGGCLPHSNQILWLPNSLLSYFPIASLSSPAQLMRPRRLAGSIKQSVILCAITWFLWSVDRWSHFAITQLQLGFHHSFGHPEPFRRQSPLKRAASGKQLACAMSAMITIDVGLKEVLLSSINGWWLSSLEHLWWMALPSWRSRKIMKTSWRFLHMPRTYISMHDILQITMELRWYGSCFPKWPSEAGKLVLVVSAFDFMPTLLGDTWNQHE